MAIALCIVEVVLDVLAISQALHTNHLNEVTHINNIKGLKPPNWQEATSCLYTNIMGGFELRTTEEQIELVLRAGLETRTAGLQVTC